MNANPYDEPRRGGWLACVAALVLSIGWPVAASAAGSNVTVVDDLGKRVTLMQPAARIITLAPSATELAFAAGAGNAVIGVIKGSDYPPAAARLPVLGDVTTLDLERIVTLAPDLIVTWPWTTPSQVSWLRDHGIAVFEADPSHIAGIADDIERIGVLAGTRAAADAAAARFRAKLIALERIAGHGPPLTVFYQVSSAPIFTLGGTQLVSEAIARCGGRNVFGSLRVPAAQVGIETVLAARPQVIIAGTDNAIRPPWLDDWRRWPALPAVRDGDLFVVDANLLHRPGPRFVEGMASLCHALAVARRAMSSVRSATWAPKL